MCVRTQWPRHKILIWYKHIVSLLKFMVCPTPLPRSYPKYFNACHEYTNSLNSNSISIFDNEWWHKNLWVHCHHTQLRTRSLWTLWNLRSRRLPAPLVIFAVAAAITWKRQHWKFFGVTTRAYSLARISSWRCEALTWRRCIVVKMWLRRRLDGHC